MRILSNFYFSISLQIGIYICNMAKENHRGFFHLLQSEIRAESTRCFAGNLNLLLTQSLAQANHDASDLLKGPERGSLLVCRFLQTAVQLISWLLPTREGTSPMARQTISQLSSSDHYIYRRLAPRGWAKWEKQAPSFAGAISVPASAAVDTSNF